MLFSRPRPEFRDRETNKIGHELSIRDGSRAFNMPGYWPYRMLSHHWQVSWLDRSTCQLQTIVLHQSTTVRRRYQKHIIRLATNSQFQSTTLWILARPHDTTVAKSQCICVFVCLWFAKYFTSNSVRVTLTLFTGDIICRPPTIQNCIASNFLLDFYVSACTILPSSRSPLASSLIRSVFHSELKTWLFTKSFPP